MKQLTLTAMALMLVGVLLFLFSEWGNAFYVYAFGALVFALIRVIEMVRHQSSQKAVSRLPQIRVLSALSLVGAAYLMYDNSNSWSVLFLVSAVLEIYVSFRDK